MGETTEAGAAGGAAQGGICLHRGLAFEVVCGTRKDNGWRLKLFQEPKGIITTPKAIDCANLLRGAAVVILGTGDWGLGFEDWGI